MEACSTANAPEYPEAKQVQFSRGASPAPLFYGENRESKPRRIGLRIVTVKPKVSTCVCARTRVVLALHDLAWLGLIASALFLGVFVTPAFGYVDPSVMTYTIQALAGVAVALSAVLGVAFRRSRKALFKALKIDENAHKEVEPDVHRVVDGQVVFAALAAEAAGDAGSGAENVEAAQRAKEAKKGPGFAKRLLLSLLISLFTVATVCVVAPYEIVAGSESSLLFTLSDIWLPLALAAAAITVVLALVLSLFKGRVFDILLILVFVLGLCCYVQALGLNMKLPVADGNAVDWSNFTKITLGTGLVWLVLIGAFLLLGHKKAGLNRALICILSIALLLVQGAGVASLFIEDAKEAAAAAQAGEKVELYQMEDGLFSVSKKANVIVFVLDTFDTAYLNNVLADDPTALDAFTGFTYFENSAGGMIPTRYGVPFLLTGVYPQVGEDYATWRSQRYARSSMVQDIDEAGYSLGLYSDSLQMPDEVKQLAMNIHPLDNRKLNIPGLLKSMYRCALYRDMPWILKSRFWYYTDQVNIAVVSSKDQDDDSLVPYTMNDALYFQQLRDRGLTADDKADKGAFRLIHLIGAHPPYTMDAEGNDIGDVKEIEQEKGSLNLVSYYLNQLKELGLYNDSTIIVTADHGEWFLTLEPIQTPTSPMILVKPAGQTEEEMNAPLQVSHVPTGHADIPATIMEAILGEASTYGDTVFDIPDSPRTRLYYQTTCDGPNDLQLIEWVIEGDALDFGAWRMTGNVWNV